MSCRTARRPKAFDGGGEAGDALAAGGPVITQARVGAEQCFQFALQFGAQVGDWIIVTGAFGGSILEHHLDFTPRVREALGLHEKYELHAAIDVSDGLSLDLARLVEESHCGAELDIDAILVSEAARRLAAAGTDSRDALDHALSDGEDFELIFAAPPEEAGRVLSEQPLETRLSRIGRFVERPGLWEWVGESELRPLSPRGSPSPPW